MGKRMEGLIDRRIFLKGVAAAAASPLLRARPAAAGAYDPAAVSAVLRAGGGTLGGIGYVQMTGLAKLVGDTYPKIKITVVPGGWIGNIPRTDKGELDVGSTTLVMTRLAAQKKGAFTADYPNVRSMLAVQDANYYVAVARKDFPAATVGEIVRKKLPARLATLAKGNATEWIWRTAFEEMGASWEHLEKWGGKMNHVDWANAVNLVKDGHVDAILAVATGKIGWLTELSTSRDLKALKWDDDLREDIIRKYGFLRGVYPAGSFRGRRTWRAPPTRGSSWSGRTWRPRWCTHAQRPSGSTRPSSRPTTTP